MAKANRPLETTDIVAAASRSGLDAGMLYECVVDLSRGKLLAVDAINAAAGILLTGLGLPAYFFRNISKDDLKRLLRHIAGTLEVEDGAFVLRSEVSEVHFDLEGGVQFRIATGKNRDHMERVLNEAMSESRVEYYFSKEQDYYTYIVRPEACKPLAELKEGESPFAFTQIVTGPAIPEETRWRYESFLKRCNESLLPLVEVSAAKPSNETRVMMKEDFTNSSLPVVRRMLSDLGITLNRAYWETYRNPRGRVESICSLYVAGMPPKPAMQKAAQRLRALLAIQAEDLGDLYVSGQFSFEEYLFATAAHAFTHTFIYKGLSAEREIMGGLAQKELRDALAKRIFDSNRAEYTRRWITQTIRRQPDLVKWLYRLFDRKFNPELKKRPLAQAIEKELDAFRKKVEICFVDDSTGRGVFLYMTHMITHVLKTNFYKPAKRSFAFRLNPGVLDPLVFPAKVHGIFFVVGFYAVGTHMRAADVARGGLRMIRVTAANYENELDEMPLLNYALGPCAQRLKHKDIAESGSKGVFVPGVEYAGEGLYATFDYTEGIMDLMQPDPSIVDYLGKPEMIFFGPDEGTAPFMDIVAERARERGYKYWRTITTGKSIGIPHDTFGLTHERKVFGLLSRGEKGTELQINGAPVVVSADMAKIVAKLEGTVDCSGMTTMSVMAGLRTMFDQLGLKEAEVNMIMTGGPGGDLGCNEIQSYKGKICLIMDSGSVCFDPQGLDRKTLMELAVARHTSPRLNSLAFPAGKLSRRGFKVLRNSAGTKLPDGTVVEDGAFFHRTFLVNPAMRKYFAEANIQAFIPCGGFKDTINAENVHTFLSLFKELRVITEGANVFFDDTARETIARESKIIQMRDSSANKGGVTSSSISEVLAAFLLGDNYEKVMVKDPKAKAEIIRAVFELVERNAIAETKMLLALHAKTGTPLYRLSVQTSEQLYALQDKLYAQLNVILKHKEIVTAVLNAYVPGALMSRVGVEKALRTLSQPDLCAYRDAVLTKKLAAMAVYRYAAEWGSFTEKFDRDVVGTLTDLVAKS